MDLHDDKSGVKDRILEDIGKSIKLVQQYAVGSGVLGSDSWLAQSLCRQLDLVLRHGLREPQRSFWPLLRDLSHSDTLHIIRSLQRVCTPLGRGRAWIHYTLSEGSLQSYLDCLARDNTSLRRHYSAHALLRDVARTQQLLTLLAGLEYVQFDLDPDIAHLDVTGYQQQIDHAGMTSSMTSSLSSPVDSGVALLDSDADATSVSEATMNEGDALSLREEEATLPELEDNRINDHLLNMESDKKKDKVTPLIRSANSVQQKMSALVINDTKDLNAEYPRIMKEKVSKDMINSVDLGKPLVADKYCVSGRKEIGKGCINHKQMGLKREINKSNVPTEECVQKEKGLIISNRSHSSGVSDQNRVNEDDIYNRMTKSCIAYVEHRSSVSNILDIAKPDDILTDNKQNDSLKANSNIMSMSVGCDGIVLRRQRKKKRNGPDTKVKRVSFHEDFITQHKEQMADFSVSFLPPNSVIKRDVIKGRYSWCAEGDAPFVERRKNDNDTKSDVYLSSSTLTSEETGSDGSTSVSSQECKCGKKQASYSIVKCAKSPEPEKIESSSIKSTKTPPVAERGTPEGQEDPPKTNSTLHLNSITDGVLKKFPSMASSIDWSSDTESDLCDRLAVNRGHLSSSLGKDNYLTSRLQSSPRRLSTLVPASKTTLLSRFMRSLTEKKFVQHKMKLLKPSRQLYIRGAKPSPWASQQFLSELEAEVETRLEQAVDVSCQLSLSEQEALHVQVLHGSTGNFYKVFKVSSSYFIDGLSKPLLALLTNNDLYFVGKHPSSVYQIQFSIAYKELDAIMVGPNSQTAFFVSSDRSKQFLIASGDRMVTEQLVCHVEMAMRKSSLKPALPAVGILALDDMKMLIRQLVQSGAVAEDEVLNHYSLVHVQDDHLSPPTTPMGPIKEGHLMFRPATDSPLQPWEPGYFILKGGVLYMFGDVGHRLPKRIIPLHAGQCQGCRRMLYEQRPHTFEILLGHHRSFQFAAADEYEASDWLQALVQAAFELYEYDQAVTTPCSLVVTSNHILTCEEKYPSADVQILACAAIIDMTAFSVTAEQGSWCMLEFGCREVHETSGDWVLYFSTSAEMIAFRQVVEHLWKQITEDEFPLQLVTDENLLQRCLETSQLIAAAWNDLLPDYHHK